MAMYYGDSNGVAQRIVVTGMQGPAGPQGATGPQGPAGQGVPAGGTAGQVLTQSSNGPVWADPVAGLGELVQTLTGINVYKNGNLISLVATEVKQYEETFTANGGMAVEETGLFVNYRPPVNYAQNVFRAMYGGGGTILSICNVNSETGKINFYGSFIGPSSGGKGYISIFTGDILVQYYIS